MAKVVVGMTVSLDGFVNDPNGDSWALYPDFEEMHDSPALKEAIENTGAVILGRRSFDMADDPDWYAGDYEFQCPIFVLTHRPPEKHPKENEALKFTFVEGIENAVRQAKAAASDKDVQIIGASAIQQCIRAGLADELDLDVMPVLLGGGTRLFEGLGDARLEKIDVLEHGPRTTLRFRFLK